MIVTCLTCRVQYDDESRWTICPHNSLNVAHDTPYCRRHDLYNCQVCKQLGEDRAAMKGEPRPTSAHSIPFEYDPTPLAPGESRVVVREGPDHKVVQGGS